jgi:hypothetical protein
MKTALHVISGIGIGIVALYAVGFAIAAVFGLLGGLFTVLFWASVLAGLIALASMVWRLTVTSK